MNGQRLCEACRLQAGALSIDDDDPQQPYWLCPACAERLAARSLRPLEWFNLAAIHGPAKFLLHDDFYDEHGTAYLSELPVVAAETLPAPTLELVASDVERLIDYAMTQYFLSDAVVAALKQLPTRPILRSLERRVAAARNADTETTAYTICARVLGPPAGAWLRRQWHVRSPETLSALAEASAVCLPPDEGWQRVVDALADVPAKEVSDAALALAWFRSEATLGWIEQHAASPVVKNWGRIAAVSQLRWDHVARWLQHGRPLSLIALDALNNFWDYDFDFFLELYTPKLLAPESIAQMTAVLQHYAQRDPVPRVENSVARVMAHWAEICHG